MAGAIEDGARRTRRTFSDGAESKLSPSPVPPRSITTPGAGVATSSGSSPSSPSSGQSLRSGGVRRVGREPPERLRRLEHEPAQPPRRQRRVLGFGPDEVQREARPRQAGGQRAGGDGPIALELARERRRKSGP